MKIQNYINGEWQEPSTGQFAPVINPATGETIAEVAMSGPNDIDEAV